MVNYAFGQTYTCREIGKWTQNYIHVETGVLENAGGIVLEKGKLFYKSERNTEGMHIFLMEDGAVRGYFVNKKGRSALPKKINVTKEIGLVISSTSPKGLERLAEELELPKPKNLGN